MTSLMVTVILVLVVIVFPGLFEVQYRPDIMQGLLADYQVIQRCSGSCIVLYYVGRARDRCRCSSRRRFSAKTERVMNARGTGE